MKYILIGLFICIVAFLFMSRIQINFNPFQIKLPRWKVSTGIILITIGITFIANYYYTKGFNEALENSIDINKENETPVKENETLIL